MVCMLTLAAKVFLEKIIPSWWMFCELHSDEEPIFLVTCVNKSVLPGQFYTFSLCLALSTLWFSWIQSWHKHSVRKIVEVLRIPLVKVLPLVLLNLISTPSTPFRTQTLTLWDSHRLPNVLGLILFWSTADKRDIFQYYKDLIASIKYNNALVEQSFSQCALGIQRP